jgi:hypothetical protein
VALIVASLFLIAAYQARTAARVAAFDDEIRKITKDMGFNIYILPKDLKLDDFHGQEFGEETMDQSLVNKLANSKEIVTINHLRPALIRKVEWPEQNRQIVLMGVSGVVPWTHRQNPKKPLAPPVPERKINLGHLLAKRLQLPTGSEVSFRGEKFVVNEIYAPRGNTDDITAWVDLPAAQRMLQLEERINMIQALECNCASLDRLAEIEQEISGVLGDEVQVIELATQAIARAKARVQAKEAGAANLRYLRRASWIGFSLVTVVGSLVLAMMFLKNATERSGEIGMLRAIGVKRNQILGLFLGKSLLVGMTGGVLGLAVGLLLAAMLGPRVVESFTMPPLDSWKLALIPCASAVITVLATWIPIEAVAGKDPANILRAAS